MAEQIAPEKPGQAKQSPSSENQGEGNVEAARRYNEGAHEFAESGDVERAARDAGPDSVAEAAELEQAEDAGRARAKEEDPLLHDPVGLGVQGEDDKTIVNHNSRR